MSQPLDTLIIGAGTAGLAALREVRKRTERYLIVNEGPWGTTCARVGCMPSKALIEAANAFHRRHAFETFGLRGAEGLTADIAAVLRPGVAARTLDDWLAACGIRCARRHQAAADALATAELLLQYLDTGLAFLVQFLFQFFQRIDNRQHGLLIRGAKGQFDSLCPIAFTSSGKGLHLQLL